MPPLSEIIYTCAIIACISEDEPPPAMLTIDEIYESFDLATPEQAPFIDDKQAIIARNEQDLAEQAAEIDELQAEVKKLEKRLNSALHTLSALESGKAQAEVKSSQAQKINVEATFYTAFCPSGCTGITATGIDVSNTIYHEGKRIIAVDPNVIPLRSIVHITLANGDSFEAMALDTGGDIKGKRIDVLVESRSEAYELGRQKATVEIIRRGDS